VNPHDIPFLRPSATRLVSDLGLDPMAMLSLSTWLEMGLGTSGRDAERLFEHLRAFRGGQESFLVSDGLRTPNGRPEWTVRLVAGRAIIQYGPEFQEPCVLSTDELITVVLRWFDAIGAEMGTRLRAILDGPVGPARMKNAATAILAAVLAVGELSEAAMAKALGVPLQMERTSDLMRYYKGHFTEGPFEMADFRFNTETGSGILVLTPRNNSVGDLDYDALGEWPEFRGFDLLRPGGPHERYVVDLDSRELHFGGKGAMIEWKRTKQLVTCGEPPAKIARLTAAHGFRTPGRYWLEMSFDGGEWMRPRRSPCCRITRLAWN
jgi:hypothetical protein